MGRLSSSTLGMRGALARALALFAIAIVAACSADGSNTRAPRSPWLRTESVLLYPARDSLRPPRAVVFFFGNDIGFWQPHRQLAAALAADQYAVVGFDMRPLLRSLPEREPARDSAFATRVEKIIETSRHEMDGDTVPLVIAGHSLGAEVAIWTAAHVCLTGMKGVLAMSPGSRSHLRVSLTDIMNGPEPTGPESFSVAASIIAVPDPVRIAIIRGMRDDYARADSALLAAGGSRIRRFTVPFAGHSLKRLVTASFETKRALEWILSDHRDR